MEAEERAVEESVSATRSPRPPSPHWRRLPHEITHDGTALPTLRGGAGTTRQSSLLRATVFYP